MSAIILNDEQAAQLAANGTDAPATDAAGNVLAHLIKPEEFARFEAWRKSKAWMYEEPTEEELRRSFASKRWYTTEDVLKLLEE